MKNIVLISIILVYSSFLFGQNNSPVDTSLFVGEAQTQLFDLNEKLYANPSPLNYDWDRYEIYIGESIDCDLKKFKFILVGFFEQNSETDAGIVIFKVTDRNEIIEIKDRSFGTLSPKENYDIIIESDESYWGCYV